MTSTPLTDKADKECVTNDDFVAHARKLERELAESHAREAQLRADMKTMLGLLHPITHTLSCPSENPISAPYPELGRAIFTHIENCRATLESPPPPVIPLSDVNPLVEALARIDVLLTDLCDDRLDSDQKLVRNAIKTFTVKHPCQRQ